MTTVPLGVSAYDRTFAQEPEIRLENRFFEKNPTNLVEGSALLARPGTTFFVGGGAGPIRKLAHQPGVHNGDLFFVSGEQLFRYDGENAVIPITGTVSGTATPSITFVAGPGYDHLFIADGINLQYYDGEAAATGQLTVSGGNIADSDEISLDGVYFQWTSGSVDAGTPDGSMSDPWLVDLGASDTEALANMILAFNATGTEGTTYSTGVTALLNIEGVNSNATTLNVIARDRGTGGNSLTTTVETGANIAWGAATLEGGGAQRLNGVTTPDDVGILSLTTLAQYVLASVANSQRFYWIEPGALTIEELNFAEAESEPDQIVELIRIGDAVYMLGQSSTEVWYASGDNDLPFIRQQGLAFSQGAIQGTAVAIRTQLIVVAEDLVAYQVAGGPARISTNGIEERIRKAIAAEGAA